MAQLIKYSLILLCLGVTISCRKDSSNMGSYREGYKFYFKAEVDGSPVEYYAGEDNYELVTDYSFKDSLIIMKGVLSQSGASRKDALEIELRGRRALSSLLEFGKDDTPVEGKISLSDPSGYKKLPNNYIITLTADRAPATTYHWTFADGGYSTRNPVEKQVSSKEFPLFYAELRTSSPFCESYLRKDVHFGKKNCRVEMTIDGTTYADLTMGIETSGKEVKAVQWFLGEQKIGEGLSMEAGSLFSADGDYYITAIVELKGGCTSTVSRKINVLGGLLDLCNTGFDYELENVRKWDPKQLGTAKITYYSASGKEYTSFHSKNEGELRLAGIKPFKANERGQATLSFLFEGDMILTNPVDSSTIHLSQFFGSIAVAHP